MGAILTILLVLILSIFTIEKFFTWVNKLDVDIMSSLAEQAIDFNLKFGKDNGFFIAAALTEYDSNPEIIEDAKYGELVIDHYGWGNND